MDFIGSLKPWMSEHVFVTIGLTVAIAVAVTFAFLSLTQYGRRNIYLLLFRLMSVAVIVLGISALVIALRTEAPSGIVEISIGIIVTMLIGYAAAIQVVDDHVQEGRAARSALAKLKEQNPSVRVVIDKAKSNEKQ